MAGLQAKSATDCLPKFEARGFPRQIPFSLLNINNKRVRILALKKAEESDEVILRLVEMSGEPQQNVHVKFAAPLEAAREVTGQELPLGRARLEKAELVMDLSPYQLRTFALKLASAPGKIAAPRFQQVPLRYDRTVASSDGMPSTEGFDAAGNSLAAEMLPSEILYAAIRFSLAPAANGKPDAVVARGQTVSLPQGDFNRLYVLAASADGDQTATFILGGKSVAVTVQDWSGYLGQWDTRKWTTKEEPIPLRPDSPPGTPQRTRKVMEYAGLTPGYIKRFAGRVVRISPPHRGWGQ